MWVCWLCCAAGAVICNVALHSVWVCTVSSNVLKVQYKVCGCLLPCWASTLVSSITTPTNTALMQLLTHCSVRNNTLKSTSKQHQRCLPQPYTHAVRTLSSCSQPLGYRSCSAESAALAIHKYFARSLSICPGVVEEPYLQRAQERGQQQRVKR